MADLDSSGALPRQLVSLVFADGAGTPNTFTVPLVQGTLTWSSTGRTVSEAMHQGRHLSTVWLSETADGNVTASLSCIVPSFKGASNVHIYEWITKTGNAAGFTSIAGGDAWSYKMTATVLDKAGGTSQTLEFTPAHSTSKNFDWGMGDNGDLCGVTVEFLVHANEPTAA